MAFQGDTFQLDAFQFTAEGVGQAQAYIYNPSPTFQAQAQAYIKTTQRVYSQAQALIQHFTDELGTYNSYGGNIIPAINYAIVPHSFGQARVHIRQTYIGFGQAQAKMYAFDYPRWGQAQGYIRPRVGFGQAQAYINSRLIQSYSTQIRGGTGSPLVLPKTPTPGNKLIILYGLRYPSFGFTVSGFTFVTEGSGANGRTYTALFYRDVQSGDGTSWPFPSFDNDGRVTIIEMAGLNPGGPAIYFGQQGQNSLPLTSTINAVFGAFVGVFATNGFLTISSGLALIDEGLVFENVDPDVGSYFKDVTTAGAYTGSTTGAQQFWGSAVAYWGPQNGYGQAQAQINPIRFQSAQAQAKLNTFDYPQFGQANADIKATNNGFAQANAQVGHIQNAQAQADIKTTSQGYAQAQTYIGHFQFAQAQARIRAFGVNGFGQAAALINARLQFGQAQSSIKATTSQFGQANALIGTQVFAQAQAKMNAFGVKGYGQSQADIVTTYQIHGQANAWIIPPTVIGNAQADIKQTYRVYGLANAWVIPPTVIAQAQARLIAFDVPQFGQAQADIKVVSNASGNAKAHIHKSAGYGLALADIKSDRNWKRGQAQAYINNTNRHAQAQGFISKSRGQGQAQADIKIKVYGWAQANAHILQTKFFEPAQAQADILQTYQVYAAVQALIDDRFGLAQASTNVLRTENTFGQALGRIKQTYPNNPAQAQAMIHIRYYVQAQAQARMNVQYNKSGQAQAYIDHFKWGQAQAKINAFNVPRIGQAQAYIYANILYPPTGPTSDAHTYLVRYNNYDLPGYAQSENYDSIVTIGEHPVAYVDGSLSQYLGLQNKSIGVTMRAWEDSYYLVKNKIQKAATMLRSFKNFAKLYVQQPDAYFLALVQKIQVQKDVQESSKILDYIVTFEAKPWLISNDTYEISGTGLIDTGPRTLYDGGWTPTRILVSGTDVTITAYTESGDPAGTIVTTGTFNDLIIDSEEFSATISGVNRNDLMVSKDYSVYVGPGKTFFQIDGATSCVIQYNNRWYLSSTRRASTQAIATTVFPVVTTPSQQGQAMALINSGVRLGSGLSNALISSPKRLVYGQARAQIINPTKQQAGQARAFLGTGRTSVSGQAGAKITGKNYGEAQARAFIESATKTRYSQARAKIVVIPPRINTGQARALIVTVPPAPSNLMGISGDTESTLTWS